MDAVLEWLIGQGATGVIIAGLGWLYYNEQKERKEITKMYMQLQMEIMEILSDAREDRQETDKDNN